MLESNELLSVDQRRVHSTQRIQKGDLQGLASKNKSLHDKVQATLQARLFGKSMTRSNSSREQVSLNKLKSFQENCVILKDPRHAPSLIKLRRSKQGNINLQSLFALDSSNEVWYEDQCEYESDFFSTKASSPVNSDDSQSASSDQIKFPKSRSDFNLFGKIRHVFGSLTCSRQASKTSSRDEAKSAIDPMDSCFGVEHYYI